MPSFTIEEHEAGFSLLEDGKRVAFLSECEIAVARGIATRLNRAATTYSDINRLKQQRDELLEALKELASQNACSCGHPHCRDCHLSDIADEVIAKAEGKPTTLTRPFEIVVNGRTVETIDVEVTKRSGEEFLTPDSSEKIEQVRAKYLPPEGWTLSKSGKFFTRVGDGVWIVPKSVEVCNSILGAWGVTVGNRVSTKGSLYRIPVSAVKGEQ